MYNNSSALCYSNSSPQIRNAIEAKLSQAVLEATRKLGWKL